MFGKSCWICLKYYLSVFLPIIEMANLVCLYACIESIPFPISCGFLNPFGCDFPGANYSTSVPRRKREKARTIVETKMGCRRQKGRKKDETNLKLHTHNRKLNQNLVSIE